VNESKLKLTTKKYRNSDKNENRFILNNIEIDGKMNADASREGL
jgi:hypothetical protein